MRTLLFSFALSFLVAGQLSAQQYKFVDLHTVGTITQSQATSINDSGVVVGMGYGGISGVAGFRWRNGAMQLLPYPSGDTYVFAHGINRSGVICGSANDGNAPPRPFRLSGVTYTFPNVPTTQISEAKAIDAFNNIAGYANYVGFNQTHATLWQGYSYTDLGTLGGTLSSASDINDNGEIVGRSTNLSGFTRAFLYRNWTMQDLGVLTGNTHSEANGINNLGSVVGKSFSSSSAPTGFLWQATGGMTALPRPAGSWGAEALAINDSGVIVGDYSPVYNTFRACLWKNGVIVELDTLASIPQGYVLNYASAINNPGEIIGYATLPSGFKHAFMLIPLTLRITYPQSNELIRAGEPYKIRWHSTGMDSVKIEYSLDSGATYQTVVRNTPATADSFAWNVPDTLSAKCKIRITNLAPSALDHPTQTASESETFKVKGYRLTRFKPNGDYEAFNPAKHGWRFRNEPASMWPESWWRQFDYQNGTDPNTQEPYREYLQHLGMAPQSDHFVDWPLFVRTFGGSGVCYGAHTLSGTALGIWGRNAGVWNGSCWGFPVSALMAFDNQAAFQTAFPEIGSFTNLFDLPLSNERRSLVNLMYNRQRGLEHQRTRARVDGKPRTALAGLKSMLLSEERHDGVLCIRFAWNEGHGVAPYKLQRMNGSLYRLFVYDCNFPGETRVVIEIDSLNDTWHCPAEDPGTFSSGIFLDDSVQTYYRRAALLPIQLEVEHPLTSQTSSSAPGTADSSANMCFFNTIEASIVITDSAGNTMGFRDSSEYSTIPGGIPMTPISGYGYHQPPVGYFLPNGRYTIAMNSFRDSSVYLSAAFDNSLLSFWRTGATQNQSDRFSFEKGISFGNPDAQTKPINLEATVRIDSAERDFQLLNCAAVHNDSMRVTMPDSNQLKFVNFGPQKTYDLQIWLAGASASALFLHTSVTIPTNSSHYIVPNWQDLQHQPVKIYQDIGNIGTIHDTLIVDNQTTYVRGELTSEIPREFTLEQNYPNPFNPLTTIKYSIPQATHVTLKVSNVLGQEVATLVNEELKAGTYEVPFDAHDLASGMYLYKLQAGNYSQTKKMLLVR